MSSTTVEKSYALSRERYAEIGVDTEAAIATLGQISLSLHCWQGDDVGGFENVRSGHAGSGLAVTGTFPGKARNIHELRQDLHQAFALIPGRHRLNLHAIYGEFEAGPVERTAYEPSHFRGWVEWAKQENMRLDFNSTCFAHPKAASGFTLSSKEKDIRKYWIEHVKCCRKISASIGRELKSPCIHNIWIPDGTKDIPFDRWNHRVLLREALNEIFETDYSPSQMKDSLESKLFGIGSESYVVGSHEFYMGYALTHGKIICLDMGHFHPTESVADKISAVLQFSDELLLHVSRGVRWDSDHVVILNDDTRALAEEIVRSGCLDRIHLALDYFDASINRVGAWVLGARAVLKALLLALLEPAARLKEAEEAGDGFSRQSVMEEAKELPFGAVWDHFCQKSEVPLSGRCTDEILAYEERVLLKRQ
jgi:L-rhamnose isomerase